MGRSPAGRLRSIRVTVPWTYPPFFSSEVVSVAMYQAATTCRPAAQKIPTMSDQTSVLWCVNITHCMPLSGICLAIAL
ncbi:hypothetical protein D3C78_1401420 [compost metagenome]